MSKNGQGSSSVIEELLGIASLVLGIVSLLAWIRCPLCGLPLSVIGLVFGIVGRNSPRRRMAIAGAVISGIGLLATLCSVIGLLYFW